MYDFSDTNKYKNVFEIFMQKLSMKLTPKHTHTHTHTYTHE